MRTYLEETKTTQEAFAAALGVTQSLVAQWVRGAAVPPPGRCVEIELATGGLVSRIDLRPEDWRLIWPELVWLQAWQEWATAQRSPRVAWRQFLQRGLRPLVALWR